MRITPFGRTGGRTFRRTVGRGIALGLLFAAVATTATAAPYLLVSGRWDNTLVVIDLAKAIDPANNMTLNAVEAIIPTGNFVGLAVTADVKDALVSGSEGDGDEDDGRVMSVIDLNARKVLHHLELAWGKPGFACPPKPIPHAGPHSSFGCFTDTNGVVISPRHGGIAFTANGGTDDVPVIDVAKILANTPGAEPARIPVGTGPWGIAVSPDGGWIATANRESARADAEGNHVSLINVEKALAGGPGAEVTRLPLATPDDKPSRPRGIAITPDGKYAAITGAPRGEPGSGVLRVVDIAQRKAVGRVTGVGNETYLLALLP